MNPPPDDSRAFLGIGWGFPLELDAEGDLVQAAYEDDVAQAIRIILATRPGERVMRPDFGAGLDALAFEPMNARTQALVRHRVEHALTLWEPRIDQVTVGVVGQAPPGRIDVDVRYRIRSTNTFYNLVYPFYYAEGDRA
jgi:phage baseplate assembly protein W